MATRVIFGMDHNNIIFSSSKKNCSYTIIYNTMMMSCT